MPVFTFSRALVLIACVIFVLAAFGVGAGWPVLLVPLGLAIWAGASLIP